MYMYTHLMHGFELCVHSDNTNLERLAVPLGSATSACSSLGLCLNFEFPQCRQAAQILYMENFSSGEKPSTLAAS